MRCGSLGVCHSGIAQTGCLQRCTRNAVRQNYEAFLQKLFGQLNAGRKHRLAEELKLLKRLPERRLDDCKKEKVTVGPSSTIRVRHNSYSVHSRLIGELVQVRLYPEHLDVRYGPRLIERLARL